MQVINAKLYCPLEKQKHRQEDKEKVEESDDEDGDWYS